MKAAPTATTSTSNSVRLVVLFVFVLLSSMRMSAQDKAVQLPVATETTVVASSAENAAAASTLNFVSWFMGTKQNVNTNPSIEVSASSKKQMINSGVAPSRLLIKAFLKKASNYSSAVA